MFTATRLHARNSGLRRADLCCHLGLGKTLRSPHIQELVQKGTFIGQFFVLSLDLRIRQCFGAQLLICQHFFIPTFGCAQVPILSDASYRFSSKTDGA